MTNIDPEEFPSTPVHPTEAAADSGATPHRPPDDQEEV
jgi:hypothetical protein